MSNVRATFYKADSGRDMVKISIVGDPSIFEGKALPEHQARFPKEWAAYQAGRPVEEPTGMPLTDVPGVNADMAKVWKGKGVRTAEELAGLPDISVRGLGMGGLTARKAAHELLAAKDKDALGALRTLAAAEVAPVSEPPANPEPAQTEKRGPGRPRRNP